MRGVLCLAELVMAPYSAVLVAVFDELQNPTASRGIERSRDLSLCNHTMHFLTTLCLS